MFREIILPIFRSTRLCVTACGIMHTRCCRPPAFLVGLRNYQHPGNKSASTGRIYMKIWYSSIFFFENLSIRFNCYWNLTRKLYLKTNTHLFSYFTQFFLDGQKLYRKSKHTFYSEIIPTRCNNYVYSSQWLYSTCFGWQFHPSSGVQCCIWPFR